ncbi:hypothetical protein CEUSTIGMA_g10049.t1 [Chlamydomonas eustigma]|uniref:VHS domain-containing protein n=1 Tax=Chlamydomonas eustigma TaxID=1157962 RepID=A0A250XHV4_9CHLO|nr:hypothetical protein CEUSTIGMA_g10049.t1 [Chlamydomonas eustigma]|eukprot:GAX82623.1 hypothetical protein CEUSTIGMA_g10049.t1 [Chlamydomonas eustigma]
MTASDTNEQLLRKLILKSLETSVSKHLLYLVEQSEHNSHVAFCILWDKLQTKDSSIRTSTVQLMDCLFRASRSFRKEVCNNFQSFLGLTVGHDASHSLPPPVSSAEQLRERSLEIIEKWKDEFGKECPQIVHSYRYLRDCLGMKLPNARNRASQRQLELQARQRRTQQLLFERFKSIPTELMHVQEEARASIRRLEECLDLLMTREDAPSPGLASTPNVADATPNVADAGPAARDIQPITLGDFSGGSMRTDPADLEWEDVADDDLQEGMEADLKKSLMDKISEIGRSLTSSCIHKLRSWLRLLVQLDLGSVQNLPHSTSALALPDELSDMAMERDNLLRQIVALRNEVQALLARAQLQGAAISPEALAECSSVQNQGNISQHITLTVQLVDGAISEPPNGMFQVFNEEEEESRDAAGGGTEFKDLQEAGLERMLEPGYDEKAAGCSSSRQRGGPLSLHHINQVVQKKDVNSKRYGVHQRAGAANETLRRVQQRTSHNDRVLSSAGDEALARMVHEEEVTKARRPKIPSYISNKKTKLTGKALIMKKLGLA